MLESYAEYFRARGQNDKAGQLLAESKDSRLLWRHYFRAGGTREAKRLLEEMYSRADRIDALKGLVLVAEATSDREGLHEVFRRASVARGQRGQPAHAASGVLDVGLVAEAEQKLRSLKEKYPGEPRIALMEALVAAGQNRYAEAIDGIDQCIRSAGPETEAGLQYTASKAQLLTAAYNATSDKTYLQKAIGVYESLRVEMAEKQQCPEQSGLFAGPEQ